ncbi:YqcC family protein [Escherichia coli]
MTTHDRVRLQLQALEALLREHQHWRNDEPQPHQFNSTQPFFMDTMEPLEWLQWVLIPRMHDLLDNKQPLPGAFAVAPYYEMALATDHPQRALILAALEKLDALFADDAS